MNMKSQLANIQFRHEMLLSEMQLESRLSKTLQDLLRQELSKIETSVQQNKGANEIELHSKIAKTLEIQLRYALSKVEECFNEMAILSVEILHLKEEEVLEEA